MTRRPYMCDILTTAPHVSKQPAKCVTTSFFHILRILRSLDVWWHCLLWERVCKDNSWQGVFYLSPCLPFLEDMRDPNLHVHYSHNPFHRSCSQNNFPKTPDRNTSIMFSQISDRDKTKLPWESKVSVGLFPSHEILMIVQMKWHPNNLLFVLSPWLATRMGAVSGNQS